MNVCPRAWDAPPTVHWLNHDPELEDAINLLAAELGFQIVAYPSVEAFLERSTADTRDCILLNWQMLGANEVAAAEVLRARRDRMPIIGFVRGATVRMAVEGMQQGAFDFHAWPIEPLVLGASIARAVAKFEAERGLALQRACVERRLSSLTDREREVMEFATQGFSTRDIAERLGISPKTAEHHRARLLNKMQVANMTQLIVLVLRNR